MKKIALTSMLAVFAASSAMAASVSNPLYRPAKGEFYSVTDLSSATNTDVDVIAPQIAAGLGTTGATLAENFGYGFTDWLAVSVKGSASTSNWFEHNVWNDLGAELNVRPIDMGNWKADVFGSYSVNGIRGRNQVAFDKENTWYTWTAGVRGGYTTGAWTVAAHAAWDYNALESFRWNESHKDGDRVTEHVMRFGLDGQLYLNQNWNVVAGAEYISSYDAWGDNEGYWTGTIGVNYDFNPCSYVGVYMTKIMVHDGVKEIEGEEEGETQLIPDSAGNWEIVDGFKFGAKFGVKF